MKRIAALFWLLVFSWICASPAVAQEVIRASGAVSVALPMVEAAKIFRAENKIQLVMQAVGGTATGLELLGDRSVGIALCSREVTPIDRAAHPRIQFNEIPIGVQMVALVVSRDVWEGGVKSISANQARAIYEGRIKNWKEMGGPDTKIAVFMSEPGRGQWEMFVQWLYGEIKKAPVWHGQTVKEVQETRNILDFTRGSFSLLPFRYVDRENIFALSVGDSPEKAVEPTVPNVLNSKYPLRRPLLLVIDDKPTGAIKTIVDFMIGERGQALVKKTGYITLEELKASRTDP